MLEHWLSSARRDDAARGVLWPTIDPEHLAASGTAWQIFPNFQIGQGLTTALCYSARPHGYDPNKCIFEASCYELYPEGQEPHTEWEYLRPKTRAGALCSRRTSPIWPQSSRA
ncbi:ring hydroxylating alpha subunit family protein [Mycobacterium xenopi 3993]|nr:ring hydroxylating alpha subunit family protein [Mycobacterium xenopi 3993]